MSTNKLQTLLKWFEDNKIEWDKDALEIKESNGSFGVHAKKSMKKDKPVVKIPKECILSIKTTGIANLLDEANLEGGCPLALAVLYEIAQGEQSPWYGYLQALPEHGEDLPIFWEEQEKDWFHGTEMESAVHNDLIDLEDDYEELIEPLLEAHPYIFSRGTNLDDDPYSFDKFIKISTLISSRAFEVDAYHENALVPFADIFNHSGKNEHVHFETEFDVCDACGQLEYCEHQYLNYLEDSDANDQEGNDEDAGWEDEDEEESDEEVDDAELAELESMGMDTELPDLEELENAGVDFYNDDEDEQEANKDTCDMVLDRDVQKGEEVFNTYGDHPNIALLSKYGFCYDDNKNDYVSITEDSLIECCLAITGELLKAENPKATEKEIEKLAIERTRPRWEFFLKNEPTLCPSEDDDEQPEGRDDFDEDCQDDCCGPDAHGDHEGHDHGHAHGHGDDQEEEEEEHAHEHEHDEEGGCCGGEDDEEQEQSRPYFINYEGLFEDKLMCLLHIMFISEKKFATFVEDVDNALSYFEELANSQGAEKKKTQAVVDLKRNIYQVCRALAEFRRLEYFEDGEWVPVEKDEEERKACADDLRKYYALTCRISEKKILDRSVQYYSELVEEYSKPATAAGGSSSNKKKPAAANKKNKKMKL
ncbi:hypothetical protein V8B55DRAFT_1446075 [Mucor lusitanicus]|uniref:SET domain-containing protein n=2 Tax=Mucor circinelloides f. lusitanicus TaxID=29924 RepID=A0A168MB67_MUCCL|nr:hypothetical protein MUCCIDRAFT_108485 [Mucor lusitanicus CBS 277.49]